INIAAGAFWDLGHGSFTTGALSGAGTIVIASQVRVGTISGGRIQMNGDNSNSTFTGAITGGVARVQKAGTGEMVFNGHNPYTGVTTIAGELVDNTGDFFPDTDLAFIQPVSTLTLNASETMGSIGSGTNASTGALIKLNAPSVVLTIGGDNFNN